MTKQRLAQFFTPPSKANAARVYFINTLVAIALSMLLYIGYRSLYSPEPMRLKDVSVLLSRDEMTGAMRVLETRKFDGLSEETIGVLRSVYAPGVVPSQVQMEGGLFTATFGEFTTHHVTDLPPGIHGMWCLRTAYNWWPAWSQREYVMAVPDVCFYGLQPYGSQNAISTD